MPTHPGSCIILALTSVLGAKQEIIDREDDDVVVVVHCSDRKPSVVLCCRCACSETVQPLGG